MTNSPKLDDNYVLCAGALERGRFCTFAGATGAAALMRGAAELTIARINPPMTWQFVSSVWVPIG